MAMLPQPFSFLKTKGKKRGYSEKQEFVVDENLNIKVDWV